MVEVDNHLIKTEDLEVIYKLMDADNDNEEDYKDLNEKESDAQN